MPFDVRRFYVFKRKGEGVNGEVAPPEVLRQTPLEGAEVNIVAIGRKDDAVDVALFIQRHEVAIEGFCEALCQMARIAGDGHVKISGWARDDQIADGAADEKAFRVVGGKDSANMGEESYGIGRNADGDSSESLT